MRITDEMVEAFSTACEPWKRGEMDQPTALRAGLKAAFDVSGLPEELEHLRERDAQLSRLEAAGVDNWEGYSLVHETDQDRAAREAREDENEMFRPRRG